MSIDNITDAIIDCLLNLEANTGMQAIQTKTPSKEVIRVERDGKNQIVIRITLPITYLKEGE